MTRELTRTMLAAVTPTGPAAPANPVAGALYFWPVRRL